MDRLYNHSVKHALVLKSLKCVHMRVYILYLDNFILILILQCFFIDENAHPLTDVTYFLVLSSEIKSVYI